MVGRQVSRLCRLTQGAKGAPEILKNHCNF